MREKIVKRSEELAQSLKAVMAQLQQIDARRDYLIQRSIHLRGGIEALSMLAKEAEDETPMSDMEKWEAAETATNGVDPNVIMLVDPQPGDAEAAKKLAWGSKKG